MANDIYYTLEKEGSGKYTEKMSRFLSFAIPVTDAEEARILIKEYQNEYHDARHLCWAYMLGPERKEWQLNDNGEPSGTAGKPILGQINSAGLTDILVMVVRYFGGIKLGTSGLISAYREAARLAIEDGGRKEMCRMEMLSFSFPYMAMNDVMKIVKGERLTVISQDFNNTCTMTLEIRLDDYERIKGKIIGLDGVTEME